MEYDATGAEDSNPLLSLVNVLLYHRWFIGSLAAAGAVIGLLAGLLSTRVFVSSATFLPQASDGSLAGLALAASQFGVRLPNTQNSGWGPPVYVELLRSRVLLQPIAQDTLTVPEKEGEKVAVVDLLKVKEPNPSLRLDKTILALRRVIQSQESKALNGVQLTVTTPWPSVSASIAQRLVDGVSRFNLETRKSQASAERRFVEARVQEVERSLREAEDRLQLFMQRNRTLAGSPQLGFERDRLQREVSLRQQLYTTLLQSFEEARVREVRDTPVITILEAPQIPVIPSARRSALKAALGLMGGCMLGVVLAFLLQGLRLAKRESSGTTREFFRLVNEITPGFLRRYLP